MNKLSELEEKLKELAFKICDLTDGRLVPNDILPELREALNLGTLNGLDKAIELMPEEIPYEKGSEFIGEYDYTKCDVNDSFNSCRSQILSKIKEFKNTLND